MVAPREPVAIDFGTRHTWPSRSSLAALGGIAAAFLTDLTVVLSVRTALSGVRSVVTCSLSHWADPSRLGADRFKTEGDVIVELGVRRRWPFRHEGPNGSALLLEVRLLSSGTTHAVQRRRALPGLRICGRRPQKLDPRLGPRVGFSGSLHQPYVGIALAFTEHVQLGQEEVFLRADRPELDPSSLGSVGQFRWPLHLPRCSV
ncbi:hypothetical protein Taro_018537, partial [Colocasia esculenta]|nr:hypothetical protein [Colocasia esculenta]